MYKINILIMFILSLLYLVLCQIGYYIQPTIGSRFQRGVNSKFIVSCNNKPKVFQLQEWFSDSVMLSIIHLSSIYHLAILMMVLLLFARWLHYFQATHPNLTTTRELENNFFLLKNKAPLLRSSLLLGNLFSVL